MYVYATRFVSIQFPVSDVCKHSSETSKTLPWLLIKRTRPIQL